MQAKVRPDAAEASPDGLESLALALSRARGLDEIMQAVRAMARPLLGADGITFVLRDGDRCHYAEEDAISPLWKGQRFPIESCISGWAMTRRELVVIEDIYADDRIPHAAYRPTFVRSLAMAPVRVTDPVAAIGAYWKKHRTPTPQELATLESVANFAAVGMTNVTLIESLTAARDEAVREKAKAVAAREEADRARDAIIMAMASLAETRDDETTNHVHRTQHYVGALAEAAFRRGLHADQLTEHTVLLLRKAAPLHDIGKVGIPDRVLLKPASLDAEETAIMRTHAELGRRAIAAAERHFGTCIPFFQIAQEVAHTHHERWDGTGYPRGLKGEAIPLSGRLMALADVYDALVSDRVYKAALPHEEAVRIILSERGRHFDPALVDVFVEIAPEFRTILDRFRDPA